MSDETQFGLLLAEIEKLASTTASMRGEFLDAVDKSRSDVMAELAKVRGEIMARLDRHGDELSAIHEDIIVDFGASDQVRRANLNTREELRLLGDQVNAITRQILRLQTEVRELKREP